MKQLDTSSLRKSVTLSIITTMFILIITVVSVTNLMHIYTHDRYERKHTLQVYKSIEQTINLYVKEYIYNTQRIINTTPIIKLLKQRDREEIYKLFKPKWDLMHEEEPYLKVMHIRSEERRVGKEC